MSEKFTLFWNGPFSQWYPAKFEVEGKKFVNAEQYMMAGKALHFNDDENYQKIMRSPFPAIQKALGRKVANFNVDSWNNVAKDIVYKGNYAKFTQNEDLKKVLIDTYPTTLVEASPVDKIWGIGLAEDNPDAHDRSKWQGKNWLGEVLTKVRHQIMVEEGLIKE